MSKRDQFVADAVRDGYSEAAALDEYYENEGLDYDNPDYDDEAEELKSAPAQAEAGSLGEPQ